MHLIAGDIGGTKTLLALARAGEAGPEIVAEQRFSSAAYSDIVPMIRELLDTLSDETVELGAACFAIAGPIEGDGQAQYARLTNQPWDLDAAAVRKALDIPGVKLINDLASIAHAVDVLPANQRVVLQEGRQIANGQRLVAAPGTGFNSAIACPGDGPLRVLTAESGHAAFSPANLRQLELIRHFTEREGRCSREHLLAGPGLPRLLDFICREAGHPAGAALQQAMHQGDPSAAIGEAAIAGSDGLAVATLELYADILAGQLADLALAALPTGGAYLAGGIPPKILPFLQAPGFLSALHDRPPMNHLLEALHVEVILDQRAGLLGALEAACQASNI
ncbi:MAG: glucokinase [Acidihalobacter sp.]|uniref:glucokinase n=1 Tax=Acidihalobacter sp. TaxID=1872108 RepID=UPI00307E132A